MKSIKAIVLTYDKYRSFTDHMILCYGKLWPDHPFIFYIPYQNLEPTIASEKVKYIKAPSDIQGTVQSLLHNLDDEEMVYWCIDDKYPIKLTIDKIKLIHDYLLASGHDNISGLLYCRCRGMLDRRNLTGKKLVDDQGLAWLERKNYRQIWIHQYLRVKVLRYLFNSFPQEIRYAKEMDYFKDQLTKPKEHRLFVTSDNLSAFGESTFRGKITKNCLESMQANHLHIPPWISESTPHESVIMGNSSETQRQTFFSALIQALKRF